MRFFENLKNSRGVKKLKYQTFLFFHLIWTVSDLETNLWVISTKFTSKFDKNPNDSFIICLNPNHPTKFEHGRVSLPKVSFLQFLTYRLLPRLKRSAREWSRTLCTQITKFACLYTFSNVRNPKKVKNKNIDF